MIFIDLNSHILILLQFFYLPGYQFIVTGCDSELPNGIDGRTPRGQKGMGTELPQPLSLQLSMSHIVEKWRILHPRGADIRSVFHGAFFSSFEGFSLDKTKFLQLLYWLFKFPKDPFQNGAYFRADNPPDSDKSHDLDGSTAAFSLFFKSIYFCVFSLCVCVVSVYFSEH